MQGLDSKVDSIEGWLKDLQCTVNNLSEIVHSWQGERRVYMLVLGGLHLIVGIVLVGIWSMVSDLRSDIGGDAVLKERVIGVMRADVEVIKVRQEQIRKEIADYKGGK